MSAEQPKIQLCLAFNGPEGDEVRPKTMEGIEAPTTTRATDRPASAALMEEVCDRENLKRALQRVKSNKGSAGVDGMTVDELPAYLKAHWPAIRSQLLSGTYQPQPVRRVEIPKPDGGLRALGIPTVLDRLIQQAVLQVLQRDWDPTFSESSYGFRPGRSAHQTVARAQRYVAAGSAWVVDILRPSEPRPTDGPRGTTGRRSAAASSPARLFERRGDGGGAGESDRRGDTAGRSLVAAASNLVLDVLDRELERRGLRFVRYADDCHIYVRSRRAGQRVMASVTRFLTTRLSLTVTAAKSAVARPWERKLLGLSFTSGPTPKRRVALQAVARMKARVRILTRRTRGVSLDQMVRERATYLTGWRRYFDFCETPMVLQALDSWIQRRLRCAIWKQWKRGPRRFAGLRARGVGRDLAAQTAGSPHGPWHLSLSPALSFAFPSAYFQSLGLPRLAARPTAYLHRTAVCGPACTVV